MILKTGEIDFTGFTNSSIPHAYFDNTETILQNRKENISNQNFSKHLVDNANKCHLLKPGSHLSKKFLNLDVCHDY